DRFLEKPETTQIVNDFDGLFDAAERGHYDGRRQAIVGTQGSEEFEAVDTRHHQVGYQNVDGSCRDNVKRFPSVGCFVYVMSPLFDNFGKILTITRLIVDDENFHALDYPICISKRYFHFVR